MKLGLIGRAWLGFQAVKFVKIVVEERHAYHARRSDFCGYTKSQAEHIFGQCCQAVPDMHSQLMSMDEDRRTAILKGILTCHPDKFRERFGFDRPSP